MVVQKWTIRFYEIVHGLGSWLFYVLFLCHYFLIGQVGKYFKSFSLVRDKVQVQDLSVYSGFRC